MYKSLEWWQLVLKMVLWVLCAGSVLGLLSIRKRWRSSHTGEERKRVRVLAVVCTSCLLATAGSLYLLGPYLESQADPDSQWAPRG